MDERTEDQKVYDTALRSEKRTIGHRMSRKVLVIAPDNRRAQQWADEHGIAFSDTIFVGPANWANAMQGSYGVEHVIVGWYAFDEQTRPMIRNMLACIESAPFEGEPVDSGLLAADPVRD